MIITYFGIIVFQLVTWLEPISKTRKSVFKNCYLKLCMLWLAYNVIPTEHEVLRKLYV